MHVLSVSQLYQKKYLITKATKIERKKNGLLISVEIQIQKRKRVLHLKRLVKKVEYIFATSRLPDFPVPATFTRL